MYLRYLRLYTDTPPQFHMAQPNGIGKLGNSRRDLKVDRKAKQNSFHGHHQVKTNKYRHIEKYAELSSPISNVVVKRNSVDGLEALGWCLEPQRRRGFGWTSGERG